MWRVLIGVQLPKTWSSLCWRRRCASSTFSSSYFVWVSDGSFSFTWVCAIMARYVSFFLWLPHSYMPIRSLLLFRSFGSYMIDLHSHHKTYDPMVNDSNQILSFRLKLYCARGHLNEPYPTPMWAQPCVQHSPVNIKFELARLAFIFKSNRAFISCHFSAHLNLSKWFLMTIILSHVNSIIIQLWYK